MKKVKFFYYVTTGVISGMMLFIAYETLTKPEVKISMEHLGFPDYFRVELGIAKIIGAILIWLSIRLLRDMAYFGFALMFASASLAHLVMGDPISKIISGLVFLAILIVSYVSKVKLEEQNVNIQNNKK